jgi:hypothetical protein
MKKTILAAAIVGALAIVPTVTVSTPAVARDSFSFSFNTGNVRMAYRDGFYDQRGRWHNWRNAREAREFRYRYGNRYRDIDRDGVPNRFDRDRDGDGVPNRFDRRPANPWRN